MVYKYKVPYKYSIDEINVTMIFNLNEWFYEQAIEYNKDSSTAIYDLDYGEHLMLNLRCEKEQCTFSATVIGVYDDKKGHVQLVKDEGYHVNLSRSNITDIVETEYAPVILRNFMKFLRPFDIPDYWYSPQDVCGVVEKIKKFFEEYLNVHD